MSDKKNTKKNNKKQREKPLTFLCPKPNNGPIIGNTNKTDSFPKLPASTEQFQNQEKPSSSISTEEMTPNPNLPMIPKISPLQEALMHQVLRAPELLPFIKDQQTLFKNLSEIHKNLFYIRKNTIQKPLLDIHNEIFHISTSLFSMAQYAGEIAEYFLLRDSGENLKRTPEPEIMDKMIRLSEYGFKDYQKMERIRETVDNLILSVQTKKKYQNRRHFHPSIYLSPETPMGDYPHAKDQDEESVGSDDEELSEERRMNERCSRCHELTHGDIRYLRISCFYDMSEAKIPGLKEDVENRAYVLPICKDCRHEYIFHSLPQWVKSKRNPKITQNHKVQPEEMDEFIRAFSNIQ